MWKLVFQVWDETPNPKGLCIKLKVNNQLILSRVWKKPIHTLTRIRDHWSPHRPPFYSSFATDNRNICKTYFPETAKLCLANFFRKNLPNRVGEILLFTWAFTVKCHRCIKCFVRWNVDYHKQWIGWTWSIKENRVRGEFEVIKRGWIREETQMW